MTTKIRRIPFVFDVDSFITEVQSIAQESGLSMRDVSILADRSPSYMEKLIDDDRSNIEMNSLLSVCNAIDIDPRKFFVLRG